jgi:sulfite exporter TauE/SafE/copper chaperone CopZ
MHKTQLPIRGMHCRSCELLIEDELKAVPGVSSAHVSLKGKSATVQSKQPIDQSLLEKAVKAAGYQVGADQGRKTWLSKNPSDYRDLGIGLLAAIALFFLARSLGLFNINVGVSEAQRSLPIVFLVGLTAGVSTCMALVGGLILGISARHAESHPEATSLERFRPHIFFNIGRVVSYFVLGGLVGLVGKAFQFSSLSLGLLTMAVGAVMLFMGLQLTQISPRLSGFSLSFPSGIARFLGIRNHHEREYNHWNSMGMGALTFFLPCGFTQAMQLYAMGTGSFLAGALIMSVFALGTTPGLLGIGGLTSAVRGSFARAFFRFVGVLVIFLSLFNLSNGYNLTGWTLPSPASVSEKAPVSDPNVNLENGQQVVHMVQTPYGYKPNQFTVRKGIPVKWVIDAEDLNSCSSGIALPKFGIRKDFTSGENIITFTPTEVGVLKFTCSMGMYPGQFNVVN